VRAELAPGFFLLGEVWGGDRESLDPYFAGEELDAGFDFGFQGSTVGWLEGRGRTIAYERYLESRMKVRPGHLLAQFLSSHDVKGALAILGGDREAFRLAAVLELTTMGIPVIFYGEEVARDIGAWPDNRSDFPWGDRSILPGAGKPRDEGMRAFYQKLIAIRRAHPALSRGSHEAIATDGDLLAFARREAGKDAVIVAVNRGSAPSTLRVNPPQEWGGAPPVDALGGAPASLADGIVEAVVPPRSALVLSVAAPKSAP